MLYFTTEEGLYRIDNNQIELLKNEKITAITGLKDKIVFSSENTLYSINDSNNSTRETSIVTPSTVTAITKEYQSDNIFTYLKNGSIYKFQSNNLKKVKHNFQSTKLLSVQELLHDQSNILWLVTHQGIYRLNEETLINHPVKFNTNYPYSQLAMLDDQLVISADKTGIYNFIGQLLPEDINNQLTTKGKRFLTLKADKNGIYFMHV